MSNNQKSSKQEKTLFQFFNEVAIINQLASNTFNQCMPEGLHISHFIAINHLMRMGDEATPVQISSALQVTKATMTHTLNVLKKRDFIEIRSNPTDGRSKLVHLTKQGVQFQKKAILALSQNFEFIREECDVKELLDMLPALQKLCEVLDSNRNI